MLYDPVGNGIKVSKETREILSNGMETQLFLKSQKNT